MEPAFAALARVLVQLLLELDGQGLVLMLDIVAASGYAPVLLEMLAIDPHVKGLLLLHVLHPEDLETRVHKVVERLRPHLAVTGVSVQAARIEDGAVRLELRCAGNGGLARAEALRREIEDAVFDAAPDIAGIEILGLPVPAADPMRAVVWSWSRDQARGA
jgi:hypothetical protein